MTLFVLLVWGFTLTVAFGIGRTVGHGEGYRAARPEKN